MPERSFWEYIDPAGIIKEDVEDNWYYAIPVVGTGFVISDTADALREWKAMAHDERVQEVAITWDSMGQILTLLPFDELNEWQEKYDELADAIDERIRELNNGQVRTIKDGQVVNNKVAGSGLYQATLSANGLISWQATKLLGLLELYRDLARSNQKILLLAMQASQNEFGGPKWWEKTNRINKMLAEQTLLASVIPLLEKAPDLDYTGYASYWGVSLFPENSEILFKYLGNYGNMLEQYLKNPNVLGPNAPIGKFYDPTLKYSEEADKKKKEAQSK